MDVVSTDEVPPGERFAYWREVNRKLAVPYDLRCDPRTESAFRAHVGFSAVGPVQAVLATVVPHATHRTAKLIRQSDPEVVEVACTVRGGGTVTQDGRRAELRPGDLVLLETWRPYQVEHAPQLPVSQVLLLHFPRSLLPLPATDLRRLTAVRIPGEHGIGALSGQFLLHLARQLPALSPAETARLATLTVEVLTTALAHALDNGSVLPAPTRQRVLRAEIHAFIRANLGNPRLNPEMIAAAHHISLRYLHKLFQQDGHTVAGYIRECRLRRCRRDLADPGLAGRPIQAIAARWGFASPAHFSQAFRGAYGVSPRQFRRGEVHAD